MRNFVEFYVSNIYFGTLKTVNKKCGIIYRHNSQHAKKHSIKFFSRIDSDMIYSKLHEILNKL